MLVSYLNKLFYYTRILSNVKTLEYEFFENFAQNSGKNP